MTQDTSVSVILPNFNGAAHLEAAIRSFVDQDHPNKELVIVDGKSSDGSHEIIEDACARRLDIRWVRDIDTGISDAFNRGFAHSAGAFIGFLGSDDRLLPGILRSMTSLASVIDADAFWFNSYTWWVEEGRCVLRKPPTTEFTQQNLLGHGTLVGWQNIYFKRHAYEADQPSTAVKWAMDYELYLRMSRRGHTYVYVDEPATVNLFDTGGLLGKNISADVDGRQFDESCVIAAAYSDGVTVPYFRR